MIATNISIFDVITMTIALIGAILGIVNTWRNIDQSRVKLVILPIHIAIHNNAQFVNFGIEVTNLSAFPVTIKDVGFLFRGTKYRKSFTNSSLYDSESWPIRLESRSSATIYGKMPETYEGHTIKSAYACTACGVIKTGTSPILKQIAKRIHSISLDQ